jgi:hypothetical protein
MMTFAFVTSTPARSVRTIDALTPESASMERSAEGTVRVPAASSASQ